MKSKNFNILSLMVLTGFIPVYAASSLITVDLGSGTQGQNNGPASAQGYNLYTGGSVASGTGVITYGTNAGAITTVTPNASGPQSNGGLTVNLVDGNISNYEILESVVISSTVTTYPTDLTIAPVAGAAVGSAAGLQPQIRVSNTSGAGVGVGPNTAGSNGEIDRTSSLTETLSFNFSQPVLLVAVRGGFWDTGASGSLYTININGTTFNTAEGNGGWQNLTNSALGYTQTTIDGVTGVLLSPGQTFSFTPVLGPSNTGSNANGHINELSFYVVPEPTAMALGALGLLGLLRRRRS